MNARDIQRALVRDLYRETFVVMNYTPANWWECDVFQLTNAGFMREFEIKVSRADFKADADKVREVISHRRVPAADADSRHGWERFVEKSDKKHDLLADPMRALAAGFNVPVQFWFVAPQGLIRRDELPAWAGLIEAVPPSRGGVVGLLWQTKHDGARLHEEKIDEKVRTHARGVCYWRMHHYFLRNEAAEAKKEKNENCKTT